jgi:hypothetical protein
MDDAGREGAAHRRSPQSAGRNHQLVGVLSIKVPWTAGPNEKRAFSVGTPNTLAPRRNIGLFKVASASGF